MHNSSPDALRQIGTHAHVENDGVWVADVHGQPSGYVAYGDLVAALGDTLATTPHKETTDALSG